MSVSLRGPVGKAFLVAARDQARQLPAAGAQAAVQSIEFAGFRDGDTTTVLLNLSGTQGEHMWFNAMDYYFVRDSAADGWRSVGHGEAT